jgi:hypothetical protein
MSDIQRYLLDYDRNKKDASATAQASATRKEQIRGCRVRTTADLETGLQNGDLKLLTLIEELGEFFNSEDGAVRSKSECDWRECRKECMLTSRSHVLPRGGAGSHPAEGFVSAAEYVAQVLRLLPRRIMQWGMTRTRS